MSYFLTHVFKKLTELYETLYLMLQINVKEKLHQFRQFVYNLVLSSSRRQGGGGPGPGFTSALQPPLKSPLEGSLTWCAAIVG